MTGQTQLDDLVMSEKFLSDPQTQITTTPVDTAGEKHTYTHTLIHLHICSHTLHTHTKLPLFFNKITAMYASNVSKAL